MSILHIILFVSTMQILNEIDQPVNHIYNQLHQAIINNDSHQLQDLIASKASKFVNKCLRLYLSLWNYIHLSVLLHTYILYCSLLHTTASHGQPHYNYPLDYHFLSVSMCYNHLCSLLPEHYATHTLLVERIPAVSLTITPGMK